MKRVIYLHRNTKDFLLLLIGSFVFSIGVNYFIIPNRLSEGGVIGITVITFYLFNLSPGVVNFILNTSLLAFGYKFFSKRTIVYSVISIILTSSFLHITVGWGEIIEDKLLAALFAGLAVGIGIGLIFKAGGTSGGTTILARLLNQLLGWSVGNAMLIIDITVVVASAFVIGRERAMYTLIAVYIGAKVIDVIIEGAEEKTAIMIVSNHSGKILDAITQRMFRGVTILEAQGGYTRSDKEVLYIVINKREIVQMKKIIDEIDSESYVTLHKVQEVLRKGYKGE